ncbi:tRNA-histidine guanylyltransferase 1-like [Coemansia sp. RSA 2703]|nr:tRNA-histidine guanylyltransferase 1-like [Coemansia sp. RSA 2703]
MYNTCFWTLVDKGGMTPKEAEKRLAGTFKKDKHELLYGFDMNYNNELEIFKKGSVLVRDKVLVDVVDSQDAVVKREKIVVSIKHCDIIRDKFWQEHPEILRGKETRSERKRREMEENTERGVVGPKSGSDPA